MFFLAVIAACLSDSYDPYDDTPPVVTVEFDYIVPSRINIRRPNTQAKTQMAALQADARQSSAELTDLFENRLLSRLAKILLRQSYLSALASIPALNCH